MKFIASSLIVLGFVLIIIGIVISSSNSKKTEARPKQKLKAVAQTVTKNEVDPQDQRVFIEHIQNLFSSKYFIFKKIEAPNNYSNITLLVQYNMKEKQGSFLLRIKWIKSYKNNIVEIVSEKELQDDRSYFQVNNDPIFTIIGIGGEPVSPKLLYVIPMKELFFNELNINELEKYKKLKLGSDFFFDTESKLLK
jgi:hypothetical protein